MKKRTATYLLIGALSCTQPAAADEYGDMFGLMFRMMLGMMSAMADASGNNSSNFGWGGGNYFDSGLGTLPLMSAVPGASPWGMMGANPWSGMGGVPLNSMGMSPWSPAMAGNPWGTPFAGGYNPAMIPGYMNRYVAPGYGYPAGYGATAPTTVYPATSLLSGRWYGNTGEILEVSGNRFRLQDRQSAVSGTVSIENNVVKLFVPKTRSISMYTFARNQSQLILQDASGQVLVFQQNPPNRAIRTF